MSSEVYGYEGFQDLANIIEYYAKKTETQEIINVLEVGAKEFVDDLLKLPKPMSNIRKSGYTHLVRSFAYRKMRDEIEVGWGKYYGPMVEHGTKRMKKEHPHVYPLWERNKEKYYKTMVTKIGLQTW